MAAKPKKPETDEQWMLRVCPKPPLTMSAHDDVVADWIHDCYRAGGIKLVELIFSTENWPLGSVARGRMLHYLGVLRQRAEADARDTARHAARVEQQQAEDARHAARRRAGWA